MFRRVHTNPGLLPVRAQGPKQAQVGPYRGVPNICSAPPALPAAWFLGPRAENAELLARMVTTVLRHTTEYRHDYQPGDPEAITDALRRTQEYKEAVGEMENRLDDFLGYLGQRETPFFSDRYIGHMLSDTTLPGIAGYFGAMLHNPNNVTIQASTATTLLEMLVMRDLCHMIGWRTGPDLPVRAWAHITADGSVANVEALWAAREVKFLPLAVQRALRAGALPQEAEKLTVPRTDGVAVPLSTGDAWSLLNVRRDDALALPARIAAATGQEEFAVWGVLVDHAVNAIGLLEASSSLAGLGGTPVLLTPSTRHYSWPKAAALTGWGTGADVTVPVDRDARLDVAALRARLKRCLAERRPVLMTVAVNGSTEESAVDPLVDVLRVREEFRARGLEFDVHVDAAWGGYITSVIRRPYDLIDDDVTDPFLDDVSAVPLSDRTIEQFRAIRHADSVTIDPHKMGYVQYPAGSLLYRNMQVINLLTFTGAYIGAATDPTVGMFGIEGSKPGAAAAAVFFSHLCIRPTAEGHGRVVTHSLANARQFYTQILLMTTPEDDVQCVPLALLPAERDGGDVRAERELLRAKVWRRTFAEIMADPVAMDLFRRIGPDQNIVDYGFNPTGNTDPDVYNSLVAEMYKEFSVGYDQEGMAQDVHRCRALVTMTTFDLASYGAAFMSTFAHRLGLMGTPASLNCLRSTVMNPFVADTERGDLLDDLVTMLREAAERAVVRVATSR